MQNRSVVWVLAVSLVACLAGLAYLLLRPGQQPADRTETCSSRADCGEEEACKDGKCVELNGEGGSCAGPNDCRKALVCLDGSCTAPAAAGRKCTDTRGCQAGLACVQGLCAAAANEGESCAGGRECAKGLVCQKELCFRLRGENEACAAQEQCGPDLLCRTNVCFRLKQAGQPCAQPDECASGLACVRAACAQLQTEGGPCTGGEDCIKGLKCLQGKCFAARAEGAPCASVAECQMGLECRDAVCLRIRKEGDDCTEEKQCESPLKCIDGKCAPEESPTLAIIRKLLDKAANQQVVDCGEWAMYGVMPEDACEGMVRAANSGRTDPEGRDAMIAYMRSRGVSRVTGFWEADLGDNVYVAQYQSYDAEYGFDVPSGRRFAIKSELHGPSQYSKGASFRLWFEKLGTFPVPTGDGGQIMLDMYKDSEIGAAYQIMREAPAGDDTRQGARLFLVAVLLDKLKRETTEP